VIPTATPVPTFPAGEDAVPSAVIPVRLLVRAGVDPHLGGAALEDGLHRAIAARGASCTWAPLHAAWLVTLDFPERHRFFAATRAEALAWCLAWLLDRDHHPAAAGYRAAPPACSA
jgi:hypothetical protein